MNTERKELADGWKWVKLGDVCREDRITIKPNDRIAFDLPYLSLEHIQSETGNIIWNPENATGGIGKTIFEQSGDA